MFSSECSDLCHGNHLPSVFVVHCSSCHVSSCCCVTAWSSDSHCKVCFKPAPRHLLSFASSNFLAQRHMVKSSSKSTHCGYSGWVIITHACFMPWNRFHALYRTPHHDLLPITLQTPHQRLSSKMVKTNALLRLDWCSVMTVILAGPRFLN